MITAYGFVKFACCVVSGFLLGSDASHQIGIALGLYAITPVTYWENS